jgi:hypothetical protein
VDGPPRPITLVRHLTSPRERPSRFMDRHRRWGRSGYQEVHDRRVEVIGQSPGGSGEPFRAEPVDERL